MFSKDSVETESDGPIMPSSYSKNMPDALHRMKKGS